MNPYQPPYPGQAPYYGHGQPPPPHERERLKRIASDQRMINIVVLAYLGVSGMSSAAGNAGSAGGPLAVLIGLVALAVIVAGVVFAVRMASALHGTGIAILCAVLLLVPCVGLLVLLVLNSQATRELKKAGLRVGLLGVDSSQLNGW